MAKVIDITDKLDFDENPKLKIGTLEVEVNADAETVLRLMGALSSGSETEFVEQGLSLIFKPEDVEAICSLKRGTKKLSAKSLLTIIQEAMTLVMGGVDPGEDQTRITT